MAQLKDGKKLSWKNGFSIVTCHFLSQIVIYQWGKSDNRGDNRVTIRKIPGVLSLLGE